MRPIDLQFRSSRASVVPCTENRGLEVCAGTWIEADQGTLRVSGLGAGGEQERSGYTGEVRLGGRGWRIASRADAGDGLSRTGLEVRGTLEGLDTRTAVSREERWAVLPLASTSGNLDLKWNDATDSAGTELKIPAGPLSCRFSVWGTSRGSEGQADLVDQGESGGWKVGAGLPPAWGGWTVVLSRENRNLSSTGCRSDRVFHEQEFHSARAEVRIDGRISEWDLEAGLRELQLHVPQGGLGHPSISWNRLSSEEFATVYSALSDRQDYFSGELRIDRWGAGAGWSCKRGRWKARLGGALEFLEVETEFQRRRLQVTGLIPAVSLDTLANGGGWLASAAGELSITWESRTWGRWEWNGTLALPVGGNWNDRRSEANHGGTSASLPLDPLGLWAFGISWTPSGTR